MTSIAPPPRSRFAVAALALGSLLALGGLAQAGEGDPCQLNGKGVAGAPVRKDNPQNARLDS